MLKKILIKEIIAPILIILISWIIYIIIKKIIKRMMHFKLSNIDLRRQKTIMSLILNIIKVVLIAVAIITILSIYGINTSAIVTSLGAVSVVIGLAFQDIIKDFLAGIMIIIENQYGIGDTITINSFKGEVISLGLRTTKIRAYTGEVNIINNSSIKEVINHSSSLSLAIANVMISYEEDIEKVEKVLETLCVRLTKELDNIKGEVALLGITNLGDSGIEFRITVDTEPMKQYEVQRKLLREIKLELDNNNIEIPYNQLVIHNA